MTGIPFLAFWVLLVVGWYLDELDLKSVAGFVVVYFVGSFGISFVSDGGAWPVVLTVVLDVILVLKVFGGDVRIR